MLYTSTRNNEIRVTAAQAIAQGISEEAACLCRWNCRTSLWTRYGK